PDLSRRTRRCRNSGRCRWTTCFPGSASPWIKQSVSGEIAVMGNPTRSLALDGGHPQRLLGVDVLRALAALALVFYHVPHEALGGWRNPLFVPVMILDLGYLGVTLFLVLSGFCIHLSPARRMARGDPHPTQWGAFWKRRFYRLYPPYLAAIVFSLALAAVCQR